MQKDIDIITVKGTFLRAKSFTKYLVSKWFIILVVSAIGSAVGLYIAYDTKPTYTATLNFVLSTGSKSNASSLATQFGFDVGTPQNNDVFSGDNIIALFKSQRMIKSVLFKKPPGKDILINIIVKELQWDKAWEKNVRTKNLFPFTESGQLNPIQDSLLRRVYNEIIKHQLTISRSDPKLNIYTVNTTSTNEVFACYLTNFLMDETADFYIKAKTASARQALELLQKETDSLRNLLNTNVRSTAAAADRTFDINTAMQVQRAPSQKGEIRTTVLASAYGEIVKNLELAKINLQKENPLYQIIDAPEIPLDITKTSKLIALITGGFIGGILCIMFFLTYKMFKSLNS